MEFDVEAATAHAVAQVEAAPLSDDPFAYLVVASLFPEDLYGLVLERWPLREALRATNASQRHESRLSRLINEKRTPHREFWLAVNQVCDAANRAIRRRLIPYYPSKFAPYLGPRWATTVSSIELVATAVQFASYTGAFALSPHVDNLLLLTNAFVYISELDQPEPERGTVLFRGKGLMIPSNWVLNPKDALPFLDRVAVVPYQRNTCLAYLNTPTSFHGVDRQEIGGRERRLLMFSSRLMIREAIRIFGEEIGTLALGEIEKFQAREKQKAKGG